MSDLVTFLLAQLDADEAAARAAMVVIGDDFTEYRIAEWWEKPEHARVYAGHWHPVVQAGETHGDPVFYNRAALPHIARHDPARVLADCEALRAVVEEHAPEPTTSGKSTCSRCVEYASWDHTEFAPYPCPTLLALAQPYAGEPGWRDEWRTNPA